MINEYAGLYYVALTAKEQLNQELAETSLNKPAKNQRRKPSRFASLLKRKAK